MWRDVHPSDDRLPLVATAPPLRRPPEATSAAPGSLTNPNASTGDPLAMLDVLGAQHTFHRATEAPRPSRMHFSHSPFAPRVDDVEDHPHVRRSRGPWPEALPETSAAADAADMPLDECFDADFEGADMFLPVRAPLPLPGEGLVLGATWPPCHSMCERRSEAPREPSGPAVPPPGTAPTFTAPPVSIAKSPLARVPRPAGHVASVL